MKKQPININQKEVPQELWKYGMPRRPMQKPRRTSKVINEYYVSFILVKDPKDEASYILVIDKINNVAVEKPEKINNAEQLPVTYILEQWQVEVRQRSNGLNEKMYYHPSCSKTLRSLVEVSNFIRENYPNSNLNLGQIRVQYERFLRPKGEDFIAQLMETFEKFLQANNSYQSCFQSSSNTLHDSFKDESPEVIAEMIEELLDKENDISQSNSKDGSQELINKMIKEPVEKENIVPLNAEVQPNVNQDITEDENQVAEAGGDDLGKDIDTNAMVESENWLQKLLADLDNEN